ncbi:MAG TPA: DUF4340 domain-containing protein [Gemmataceae bacterium]|jgi:hypothetical protein|nr:DUF4340 domain-containing protein [Gemmataceae bacterium]
MSFKTTYILFGILALVLVVFGVALWLGPTGRGDTAYVFPSFHDPAHPVDEKDIDTVEIERFRPTAQKLVFVREPGGQGWKMTEPVGWRALGSAVDEIVRQAYDARKDQNVDLTSNLKDWELDAPTATVTLKKGTEKTWTLNIGKEREGQTTAVVYVNSSDEKAPMAVKRSELDALFKSANNYRSKDLLSPSVSDTQLVKLQTGKRDALVLNKDEDHWRFQNPKHFGEADSEGQGTTPGAESGPISGVRELVDAIGKVRVDSDADFAADHVEDWAKYGLKSPRLQITVKRGGAEEGESVEDSLLIGNKADKKGEKLYARLESSSALVKVSAKSIEPITRVAEDPAVLRSHEVVQLDASKVDAIDIKNSSGSIKLRHIGDGWKIVGDDDKLQKAEGTVVQDFLRALTAKRSVRSFPPPGEEAKLGFDKPDADAVALWEDAIPHGRKDAEQEAKKDQKDKDGSPAPNVKGAPATRLSFVRKEDKVVYVRRKTRIGTTLLTVPDSLYDEVEKSRLAYLDRSLPTFTPADTVTRLVLDRAGQVYELIRDEQKRSWRLKQPLSSTLAPADPHNVGRMITELQKLTTSKLVNAKPSDSDLEQYGLKKPRVKATLRVRTHDKKTADYVYTFGNETRDGVYARQGQRDMVFLVRPDVVAVLDSELRDRNVFHFQPSQVKEVRLSGWKHVYNGIAFTLVLERQADKSWKIKPGGPDFKLDPDKVEAFLKELTDPEQPLAERFLPGGIKPDYQLGKDTRTLAIDLTVAGDKMPVSLTVGKLDRKEKAYYAESSTLPNQAFLVPQDRLEKLLGGVEYFKAK